ncbi:MAG: T9SS type A sorting domain-containing protein, partial [Flavisolibacter sp.]
IESSDDLVNWKTLASVINNVSITNIIEVKGSGSVIRMLGYKQGTTNKYSINEFEVYGTADTTTYIPSTEKPVIYPNPASSLVHIARGKDAIESISLYDITGRTVIQSNTTQGSLLVTLSITGLPAGIYVISIQTVKGVYRYKLLKASGR